MVTALVAAEWALVAAEWCMDLFASTMDWSLSFRVPSELSCETLRHVT